MLQNKNISVRIAFEMAASLRCLVLPIITGRVEWERRGGEKKKRFKRGNSKFIPSFVQKWKSRHKHSQLARSTCFRGESNICETRTPPCAHVLHLSTSCVRNPNSFFLLVCEAASQHLPNATCLGRHTDKTFKKQIQNPQMNSEAPSPPSKKRKHPGRDMWELHAARTLPFPP